jgi:DNA-binding response OmpR family regulator
MPTKRILIVDDEKAMRELLRDFLETEGFAVFEAADGASALEMAKTQPFDVVLTDLKMPPPDGLGVLKEIRHIRPEIAVIMCTAYNSPDNTISALELGCDGYVSKPFNLERLKCIIHEGMLRRKWEGKRLGI